MIGQGNNLQIFQKTMAFTIFGFVSLKYNYFFPYFFLNYKNSTLSYIFIANIMFLDEDCHKNVYFKLDSRTRNRRALHLLRQGGAIRLSVHVKRSPSKRTVSSVGTSGDNIRPQRLLCTTPPPLQGLGNHSSILLY